MRNRSVSSARRWIDAFRLSTSCELIDGLRQHEANGGEGRPAVLLEHREEGVVRLRGLQPFAVDESGVRGCQAVEGRGRTRQQLAQLTARRVARVTRESPARRRRA